ncbi:DNA-directed RNA polymerase [Aspergillus mulundensis]|uniref:DNA-directed RNA polymerase n=1 Tax=Aspergillus mulundensis TaxID=1810919 RepID=A0A3D8RKD2_9EURO|nr:DNA-directed RNA polymerase [Aspergillus mulundensis]RDW74493.1 DNA-directed RNA polymerase [Aspergillus mulundensis]
MLSQLVRQRSTASQLRLLKGRSVLPSPAKLRHHSHTSRLTSLQNSTSSNSSSETRPRRPSLQSSRSLATAADPQALEQLSHSENFNQASYSAHRVKTIEWDPALKWNRDFPSIFGDDASSLVIVDEFLMTAPKVFKKVKGVGGDHDEMITNLGISIKVGQFHRACNLINRLREFYPVGSKDYLNMHNQLLKAMVAHGIQIGDQGLARQMQRWFEVDMPYGGVVADATTIAIMIRMALRLFYGSKRDRAVRRYWQVAKDKQCEEAVLAVDVLTERELGELSEVCSSDLQRVAIESMEPKFEKLEVPAEDVPEIKAVEQKGLGLKTLTESLSPVFSQSPKRPEGMDDETFELHQQRRQQQLEADVMKSAVNRWRQENQVQNQLTPEAFETRTRLGPLLRQWFADLVVRIEHELEEVEKIINNKKSRGAEDKERADYGLYMKMVPPAELASLTILSTVNTMIKVGLEKGMKLAQLAVAVGNDAYEEMLLQIMLEQRKKEENSAHRLRLIKEIYNGRKDQGKVKRINWMNALKKMELAQPEHVWPVQVKAKLGAVLLSFLYDVAKVPVPVNEAAAAAKKVKKKDLVMQSVFQHSYQITWGRRSGYIHVHPEMIKILTREPAQELLGRHLPMLCKPRQWIGYKDGAYYYHQNHIVRSTPGESLQPAYVRAALEDDGMKKIREGLDILGGTGWAINRDVFNVMLEAWNTGEPIADLAPLDPKLPLPPKPSPEEGYDAEKKWNSAVRDIENQRSGYHSQRCFQNFQLEVARAYLNETFYLPHNLDFRGRAYPIPPYLNQMAADNARGLLLFSKAKPLGQSGLRWLKIQIANLAGFDKASLSEREKFAMDNLDDILDSANNGLHGRRWWLEAEDPWQCLAACCELRNALQHPNPTEYASRLPIHQDGSCNGLQHYAALGGDKAGAQQVNLEPSDRPSDVYSGVAEFVNEEVARDAAQGDPIAIYLQGKIIRKVVKQTVMTNVYGVTFLGAMKQVRKQLVDYYPDSTDEQKKQGAVYIAKKIFQALATMFHGAHDIQYWLGDCASRITQSITPADIEAITKEALVSDLTTLPKKRNVRRKKISTKAFLKQYFKTTVVWTTPLGLPVVQPYRNRDARRVQTSFQSLSVVEQNSRFCVSKRKQLQAFPPNFIHSLDATHMILSARACHEAGLTFSAVHDSFWTHPSDVDTMNQILRETFVQMHSDDVVKRLAAEFQVRYGQNLYLTKISTTRPIGKKIATWRRGLTKYTQINELITEYKRQKLLRSDDPELQAQGREMVTAASIFEAEGGSDADLAVNASLGESVVGHVPENPEATENKPALAGLEMDGSDPAIATLLGNAAWDADSTTPLSDDEPEPEAEAGLEEEAEATPVGRTRKKKTPHVWLWLPMSFRAVPEKGSWEVSRIRDSKYFFS